MGEKNKKNLKIYACSETSKSEEFFFSRAFNERPFPGLPKSPRGDRVMTWHRHNVSSLTDMMTWHYDDVAGVKSATSPAIGRDL